MASEVDEQTDDISSRIFNVAGGKVQLIIKDQNIHDKYFLRIKKHIEQLLREELDDPSGLFCIDTSGKGDGEEAADPRVLYSLVKNDSLVSEDGGKTGLSRGPMLTCFNCLGDHHLKDCPQPIDQLAINENRRNMDSGKSAARFFADEAKTSKFVPGKWSNKLKEALGLQKGEIPQFVYKMRILGYPPGWLLHAEVQSSGLKLFDGDGQEVKNVDEEEDGEIDSNEPRIQRDPNKIIEIPGFNMPLENGYRDIAHLIGMPPLQDFHMKESFVQTMKAPEAKAYGRTPLTLPPPKAKPDPRTDVSVSEMDVEDGEDEHKPTFAIPQGTPTQSPRRKMCLPPPKADQQEQRGVKRKSEQMLTSENEDEKSSLEDTSIECVTLSETKCETPESSGSSTPKSGGIISMIEGTPIPKGVSEVEQMPTPEQWSKDVADHIPFENLPGATGTFDRMRGLITKIRDVVRQTK